MRWSVFIVLQVLILAAIGGVYYVHQDHLVTLKKPPQSIAQWYKPLNKRQVWLHVMFKLRREMQAVGIYAASQDAENLKKWTAKLVTDYAKISKMVPEWEKKLNPSALNTLQKEAEDSNYDNVKQALLELDKSCQSCHQDFQTVTALLYRAPDFSDIKIADRVPSTAHMKSLNESVNKILIGFVDGRQDASLAAFSDLQKGMKELGQVCVTCHQGRDISYPSQTISEALVTLEQSLKTGTIQDKGKALGTLAVIGCADCHGTHRLSYDTKKLLSEKKDWGTFYKHSY